ncbi:MAG: hypothetical protein GY810_26580 [Aureispira sp.]|nr:hypothetical protein [Aureispira sp.]
MKIQYFLLLLSTMFFQSCSNSKQITQSSKSSFKLVEYLKPIEGATYIYDCEFNKLKETKRLLYKTHLVEGEKVYYSIEEKELGDANPIIGSSNFLFGAFLFEGSNMSVAEIFWKKDLAKLKLVDFNIQIPQKVKQDTKIEWSEEEKKTVLTGFRNVKLETTYLGEVECLLIDKTVTWPTKTYEAKIWLHKEYGVVKWIKQTGRIEELKQAPLKP